jgi:death-on-curing protein
VIYLDLEDLLHLADLAVGGKALVRDMGLISSAAARPSSAFGDFEAYPTMHEKAAALLHSLVRNPALVDGNNRLGWIAAVVFYRVNGWTVEAPEDEAYDTVIAVAEGRLDVPEVAAVLEGWAQTSGH